MTRPSVLFYSHKKKRFAVEWVVFGSASGTCTAAAQIKFWQEHRLFNLFSSRSVPQIKLLARLQVKSSTCCNLCGLTAGRVNTRAARRVSEPRMCHQVSVLCPLMGSQFINRGESHRDSPTRDGSPDMNAWRVEDVMAFAARRNLGKAYKCPSLHPRNALQMTPTIP